MASRSAMSSCGEPSIATSWLAVLMGSGGVPVARYSAPAPTRAATTAVLALVRRSR